MSELRARIAVAALGIPLALWVAWLGGWPLAIFLSLVAALAAREFYALVPEASGHPFRWLGVPAAMLLVLLAAARGRFAEWADQAYVLVLLLGLASFAAAVFHPRAERALLSAAATVLGALYTGGTLAFAVLIRHLPEPGAGPGGMAAAGPAAGFLLLMVPLIVTWAGDTAAFFGGRRFGRARLAPSVSPGKTVEGGVAGLIAAVAAGAAVGWIATPFAGVALAPSAGGLIGFLLGAVGQLGDLAESRLKREAGVKDSGAVLPGHGGVLDRFDALFFAIPAGYGLIVIGGVAP